MALQEGYSDSIRHMDDNVSNTKNKACVLRNKRWNKEVAWKDVLVGDVILIQDGDQVPADTVILATKMSATSEDTEYEGCSVDTKALDGETNKKTYESFEATSHLRTEEALANMNIKVEVDQPNSELYKLKGKLTVDGKKPLNLEHTHVLLREMTVSGTHSVWGVVIYTGKETKIEKNNETGASTKVSKVMKTLNGYIRWIFISQLILCLICAIAAGVWFAEFGTDSWYLALSDEWSSSFSTNWFGTNNVYLVGFASFFTFFILLGNMLPISLYVTIDSFIKVRLIHFHH